MGTGGRAASPLVSVRSPELPLSYLIGAPRHASSKLFNRRTKARPMAWARFTGTAFPICLYCEERLPANAQSSGKV